MSSKAAFHRLAYGAQACGSVSGLVLRVALIYDRSNEMAYTADDVKKILAGLASGRRPGYRPMTDDEFLKRYAPEGGERQELITVLKQIERALSDAN